MAKSSNFISNVSRQLPRLTRAANKAQAKTSRADRVAKNKSAMNTAMKSLTKSIGKAQGRLSARSKAGATSRATPNFRGKISSPLSGYTKPIGPTNGSTDTH